MRRRGFFAAMAALLAVLPGATWWWRSRGRTVSDGGQAAIDPELLCTVVDTLVPADETPGALDAGVPDRLLARLQTRDGDREEWARALSALETDAQSAYGIGFAQLDLDRRTVLLGAASGADGDSGGDDAPGEFRQYGGFLRRARRAVLLDFYVHPVGQEAVGYRPPLAGYPDYDAPPPRLPGARS